jgi:hypothetical protein
MTSFSTVEVKAMPEPDAVARAELAAALAEDGANAHLTLSWRPKPGEYKTHYVEVEARVGDEFLEHAREAATQLADERVWVQYNPEWPLKETEFFTLAEDEIPGGNLFPELEDFLNLDRFERKRMKKPRLYTVAIEVDNDQIALFGKRMANLKQLRRSRGTFTAVWDGDTFNQLEAIAFTFSNSFDWVLWRDVLYVLDVKNFHAEFRDNAALLSAVQDQVDEIAEQVSILGAEEFVKRCQSSVPMSSKLHSVFQYGIWREPVDKLKVYAAERGIEVEWDGDALVFDGSIGRQHAILKLLDEDRTHGPVSGRTYDSAAKQTVELPAKGT